jgi:hypothetical protein
VYSSGLKDDLHKQEKLIDAMEMKFLQISRCLKNLAKAEK